MNTDRDDSVRVPATFIRERRGVSLSRSLSVFAATFCVTAAMAQGARPPSSTAAKDEELEEVVITGIRASLEQATDIKRNADVIVDSIATEDLGKFPEANVAEALQRVTGVTISRNTQGEGSQITVRGFGPSFNRVLVNGRWFPSSTGGGFGGAASGFGFDALPAQMLSGADVYKSSSATLQDGGIGALVNIRTARPLDFKGPKAAFSASEDYEDLSGKTSPQAFALLSDTFADNRVGALLSFSFQERHTRTDSGGTGSWLSNQTVQYTDAGGATHTLANNVFFPQQQTYEVTYTDLRRTGLTGALQFQPNDQLLFTVDGLYNRYRTATQEYQLSHYFGASNITNVTVGANNTVTSLTTNEFGHTDFTRNVGDTPTVLSQVGFNTNWKSADDKLNLIFDLADSKSINNGINKGGFLVSGYQNVVNWASTGGMPSLSASGIASMGIPGGTFTDTSIERAHFIIYGGGAESVDEAREAKLDGVLNLNAGVLSDLKFGAYYSDRKSESNGLNASDVCTFCGYYFPVPASLFSVFNAGSSFLGGGVPSQWLSFDPNAYVNYLRQATGNPSLYVATPGSGPSIQQEKVKAAYLQLDLNGQIAGKPWNMNLGLRGVHTNLDSSGYSQVLLDLLNIPGDPTAYNTVYANNGAYTYVTATHSYNNVLPSLNVKLNITDDLIARFAASKTLTRPNLGSLSPVISYGFLRPNNLTSSSGNPNLRPYLSTNFDVSLEWYYKRGGYVTLAGFTKTVHDYIVTEYVDASYPIANSSGNFPSGYAPFRVSEPINVETAKVTGLEVAVQHSFDNLPAPFDGFGAGVNATFVHSPATLAPGNTDTSRTFALEGVGNSQNATVFYEKGPFGIRASFNHRDDYLQSAAVGTSNEPVFVKARGQLDAGASYKLGGHFTITLEGTNLTNASQYEFGRFSNQFVQRLDSGTRYSLGARANF